MNELKRLQAKHFQILELSLDGLPKREIATRLNLTPATVHNVTNSPVFRHEFAKRKTERNSRADAAENVRRLNAATVLEEAALGAAQTQVALLSSENEIIKQKSAMDILDRTGYPKVTKTENRSLGAQIVLTEGLLDRLNAANQTVFGEDFPTDVLMETEQTNGRETKRSSGDGGSAN